MNYFRLASGLSIRSFDWHSHDPGVLQQLSITVALGPGIHHTGLGRQGADADLGSRQIDRDANVPSGSCGGGSHVGHQLFPHFGSVVAAVNPGDVHARLDQFSDQIRLLSGESRKGNHDRRWPRSGCLPKLPAEKLLAMGLHDGLGSQTGWCRRWPRRFRWQACEPLEYPDHGGEAGMQMAITSPQGTQAGFPHRQLQPGVVVAVEGDEMQQIDGTGLEARSDCRERGLFLNLDAIEGITQCF